VITCALERTRFSVPADTDNVRHATPAGPPIGVAGVFWAAGLIVSAGARLALGLRKE